MISHTTQRFRKVFSHLPAKIQAQVRKAYKQFKKDPFYPSLRFKQIHSIKSIYSVRINLDYRAVGLWDENEIIWFWIGTHDEYEKLISKL